MVTVCLLLLVGSSCRLGARRCRLLPYRHSQLYLHFPLNFLQELGSVFQHLLGILPALAKSLALVRKPGTTFLHGSMNNGEIQQISFTRNTFAVHDIELTFSKRWSHLVLGYRYFCAIANAAIAVLTDPNATCIKPHD